MDETEPLLSASAEPGDRPGLPARGPHWPRPSHWPRPGLRTLLVFVPLALGGRRLGWHDVVVSAFCLLAIISLSDLISAASDTMGNRWGRSVGGLVNATFGNTIELLVSLFAIRHDEIRVAQAIMLGSILSDILLVLGFCIIAGARRRGVISVAPAIVDVLSSLMLVSAMALVIPAALYAALPRTDGQGADMTRNILTFSRATATVLLFVYATYLYFQLRTHSFLFLQDKDDGEPDVYENPTTGDGSSDGEDSALPTTRNVYFAILVLSTAALLTGLCTQAFMASLDGMTRSLRITKTFVALILIPFASNSPEMTQVVAASRNNKITFAVSVIIDSILQISLLALPALVILGWLMGRAMDLFFEPSQAYTLLFSVILVNQVLQDRHYTYLHGAMLLSVYAVVAAAHFIAPQQST
ncbi:hypothetical protein CDD83_10119 [Cordyceps sp. RAO-2017]|nr:hypothetical protein CDD83_10119 [Cordyceps sp. RAO-2017]